MNVGSARSLGGPVGPGTYYARVRGVGACGQLGPASNQVTVVVQVNGKVRDRIVVEVGAEEDRVRETAVSSPKVQQAINGQTIHNIIVIPQKLINIVVN